MTTLDTQNQKVFFLHGSLKSSGLVEAHLPYDDLAFNNWQVALGSLSVDNKEANSVNKLVLLSTNLVKDYRTDKFSEKQIWNPPLIHFKLTVAANSSSSFSLNQTFFNITNYTSPIIFYFTEATSNQPLLKNINIYLTILFKKVP
jgi:hypothetical protein